MKTSLREAFEQAEVVSSKSGLALANKVISVIERNNTEHKERGWTANLKPATVKKLVSQGVFG